MKHIQNDFINRMNKYVIISFVVVCMVYILSACGSSSKVPNVSHVPAGSVGASVSVAEAPTRFPAKKTTIPTETPTDVAAADPEREDAQAKERPTSNRAAVSQGRVQQATGTPSDSRAYMYTVYSGEGFDIIESVVPMCTSCHRISDEGKRSGPGPSLNGLKDRAGSRVEGLSAKEYVRQSILDPRAFTVDQCPLGPCQEIMPDTYPEQINADDLDTLVNFLLTLEEE